MNDKPHANVTLRAIKLIRKSKNEIYNYVHRSCRCRDEYRR